MADGYVRQSAAEIQTGLVIEASSLSDEYDAIAAFANATTGHNHDGTTGGGAKIPPAGLSGVTGLSSGLIIANGSNTFVPRTLTGTTNEITVTNGTGVSGNPTLSIPSAVTFTGKTITGGTFASPTLSGTPITDVLRTSGSSGIALQNSGGTTVLTVGPSNTTNATFAGALNINGSEAVVSVSNTQTLTNKTINLANNTLTGTVAQFNSALSGDDFATLANSVTLSNKTLDNSCLLHGARGYTVISGNYTLLASDAGKVIFCDSASNLTITLPTEASQPMGLIAEITVFAFNTGNVTISPAPGVSVVSMTGSLEIDTRRYSVVSLKKTNLNEWIVYGQTSLGSTVPDNNIYSPISNTVAFTTGGNERVRIDSLGNVGIGTTSPTFTSASYGGLNIWGAANGATLRLSNAATGNGTTQGFETFITPTGDGYLWHRNAMPILFGTNATERMRIDSAGRIGIGAAPVASQGRLQVADTGITGGAPASSGTTDANQVAKYVLGTIDFRIGAQSSGEVWLQPSLTTDYATNFGMQLCPNGGGITLSNAGGITRMRSASTNFDWSGQAGATDFLRLSANGTQRFQFDAAGRAYNTTGTWGTISDVNLKENIQPAKPQLAKLMQVGIKTYNLKAEPNERQIGVIAQEFEKIFPGLVETIRMQTGEDDEGNIIEQDVKSVKISVLIPIMVKALQELTERVEALENK